MMTFVLEHAHRAPRFPGYFGGELPYPVRKPSIKSFSTYLFASAVFIPFLHRQSGLTRSADRCVGSEDG